MQTFVVMLTVIVPVYNGASVLPLTVPAMRAQSEPADWIFVDDGSTDGTARVLAGMPADGFVAPGATCRVLTHEKNRGRAAARNTGFATAKSSLIVFLDADVAPAPGYLAAMRRALERPGAVAAVGRLALADPDPSDPYHRYLASNRRGPKAAGPSDALPWRYFLTCIAGVRADALREAGPFDEALSYGEDLDLAVRLAARHPGGLRFAPDALARMYDLGTLDTALAKMEEFARDNLPRMIRRHPALAAEVGAEVGAGLLRPEAGLRGRLAHLMFRSPIAGTVRRLLPVLPPGVSDYAVRYLLGYTLATAYRRRPA